MSGVEPLLVAGLGNPGREYVRTRHNIGFLVVDEMARKYGVDFRGKFGADTASIAAENMYLVKPLTFMNDSGTPLQSVAHYFKVAPERCLVISDDLDLPFGRLRMRSAGGHGGHNGLRSIIACMGDKFPRLRIGIGRGHDAHENAVVSRVLGPFGDAESAQLSAVIDAAVNGIGVLRKDGMDAAMRFINTWTNVSAS